MFFKKIISHFWIESLLIICTGLVLLGTFTLAWQADRYIGDLDGDLVYDFPIYGQDAPRYLWLAQNLASDGYFSVDGIEPEVFRTPGYPFILAIGIKFFNSVEVASLLVIALASFLVALVYTIARSLLSVQLSLVAALVFALSPNVLFHSIGSFGEIPFTLLLLLGVWFIFISTARLRLSLFLGGVCLACAALVRPIALYVPFIVVILYALYAYSRYSAKDIGTHLLLFIAGFALVVAPWIIRNENLVGVPTFSSIGVYNLAYYNVPVFLSATQGEESASLVAYNRELRILDKAPLGFAEKQDALTNLALGSLRGEWGTYLLFHAISTSKFFLASSVRYVALHVKLPGVEKAFGLTESSPDLLTLIAKSDIRGLLYTLSIQPFITIDRILMLALTVLACAAPLFRRRYLIFVFLCFIFYFAVLTGPASIPRYRMPVEPLLYILALFTISEIYALLRRASNSPV